MTVQGTALKILELMHVLCRLFEQRHVLFACLRTYDITKKITLSLNLINRLTYNTDANRMSLQLV